MNAFEAKGPDGRALWRTAYELLRVVPVSDVLEYGTLEVALDRDRRGVQAAVAKAAPVLLKQDQRAIVAVANVGYRVVTPEAHIELARARQRRSTKQLQRGRAVATHVDMSAMSPDARKAIALVATALSLQLDFNKRFDARAKKLEENVAAMSPKVERTAEEVADLQRRLAALEQKREGSE